MHHAIIANKKNIKYTANKIWRFGYCFPRDYMVVDPSLQRIGDIFAEKDERKFGALTQSQPHSICVLLDQIEIVQ